MRSNERKSDFKKVHPYEVSKNTSIESTFAFMSEKSLKNIILDYIRCILNIFDHKLFWF